MTRSPWARRVDSRCGPGRSIASPLGPEAQAASDVANTREKKARKAGPGVQRFTLSELSGRSSHPKGPKAGDPLLDGWMGGEQPEQGVSPKRVHDEEVRRGRVGIHRQTGGSHLQLLQGGGQRVGLVAELSARFFSPKPPEPGART